MRSRGLPTARRRRDGSRYTPIRRNPLRRLRPTTRSFAKVRTAAAGVARVLADGLHGVRCRRDLADGAGRRAERSRSGNRSSRRKGTASARKACCSSRPTANCTACSRASASSAELAGMHRRPRAQPPSARASALDTVERDLKDRQTAWHQESLALASQQRRCHDLELELVQLRQAAEAAERRRSQIAQESDDLASQHAQGSRASRDDRSRDCRPAIAAARRDSAARRAAACAQRSGSRAGAQPRAVAHRRAGRAGGELRRAQLPRPPGRARAAARRPWHAGRAAAGIARAVDERARVDRLDAGRGSAAAPARRCAARPSRRSPTRATGRKR